MKTPAIDIRPGEVVLGNRIRRVFPASVGESFLPRDDEDLIRAVRGEFKSPMLNSKQSAIWATTMVHLYEAGWEEMERKIAHARLASLFSGEVLG